jgi:serine/threonine-protein kinase HipA
MHNKLAGYLIEWKPAKKYEFQYIKNYTSEPISLSMPVQNEPYYYEQLPPFFDGLLPEGIMLEGLLKQLKIDRHDYMSQLIAIGNDMVGAVTVKAIRNG